MEPNQHARWSRWAARTIAVGPGWLLRPLTGSDTAAVQNSVDEHVRRGLLMQRPFGAAEVSRLVRSTAVAMPAEGRGAVWGIASIDSGKPAASTVHGILTLHAEDTDRARVGFWLAESARGRGIAAAAVRAVARETFGAGGLSALTWASPVGNVDSLRVARSAGFRPVGQRAVAFGRDEPPRPVWWAELTGPSGEVGGEGGDQDRLWAKCLVEIAAGAWQLQPIDASNAEAAEALLPISVCVPTGVWAAKEITTARVDAVVALLHRGQRSWVLAVPASQASAADEAATAAAGVVARYARGALGLITP